MVVLHVTGDEPLLAVPPVDVATVGTATIAMPDVTVARRSRLERGEAALHNTRHSFHVLDLTRKKGYCRALRSERNDSDSLRGMRYTRAYHLTRLAFGSAEAKPKYQKGQRCPGQRRMGMSEDDRNRLAARVVRLATGQDPTLPEDSERHAKHVATGREGGRKGGTARAKKLTPEQRSASARKAAQARWAK